ncbi:phage tail sheath C-terminal domain-containing protein [Flavobacterium procerum]|uniref:Phage tail sheath C-terminal domain-containing protein n=1 Tax=Flavobacterium procerum TaxID=1455569 RepID=A0ABV6BVU3_9FLAO
MINNPMTPGVYIDEKNAFPSSAVSVETAVPVFIGYTEKAEWNGKSLVNVPTRVTSFAEYVERFGGGFKAKFKIVDANPAIKQETFSLDGKNKVVEINKDNVLYLFNSIRLFYANGGGPCYILTVDTFKDKETLEIKADDFLGSTTKLDPFEILKKEFEPTLVVVPDAIALGEACYNSIYTKILSHCATMQSRFGLFDLVKQLPSEDTTPIVTSFREGIGMNDLKYGAAYYPWLKSGVVQPGEVTFENLDDSIDLAAILPKKEEAALNIIKIYKTAIAAAEETPPAVYKAIKDVEKAEKALEDAKFEEANTKKIAIDKARAELTAVQSADSVDPDKVKEAEKALADLIADTDQSDAVKTLETAKNDAEKTLAEVKTNSAKALESAKAELETAKNAATVDADKVKAAEKKVVKATNDLSEKVIFPSENDKLNYHQSLKATSPTYTNILEEIRSKLNELPPSAAMAGIYTAVDSSRGVWKSPANVSVSMVNAPSVNISSEQQESLNVDVVAGKSINVIRSFPGIGTLVWGARTLDGNSQDWRYINVRRTLIMIEQSLKLATRSYVFEPNDANTWVTVKSMMSNFLTNLWKQGALAGAAPEQAFDVQIGLGSTMTPTDILDGKMLITVKVAIVRPAEFIIITFQQQMQQS